MPTSAYEAMNASGQEVREEIDATSIVFENPTHDFPQRVGYRRVAADRMLAWIEGTESGKPRRQEFPLQRIECPK